MNSKKIISGLLALTLVFGGAIIPGYTVTSFSAVTASAATLKSGDFIYDLLEDGTAEIVRYAGSDVNIEIPSELDEVSVTKIKSGAFSGFSKIESIVIPDGIVSIGDAVFNQCSALTDVEIPDSVVSIGGVDYGYI